MKKIYVIPLMDADSRFASWLKEEIKTSTRVDIAPEFFEVEELNRGVWFGVPGEKEMEVVNAIFDMEDIEVFKRVSFDEKSGKHIVEDYYE